MDGKTREFMKTINDAAQAHYGWVRAGTWRVSLVVGIGMALYLISTSSQKSDPWAYCSAGGKSLLGACASFGVLSLLAHMFLGKQLKACASFSELRLFDHLGAKVGALLFFIQDTKFDGVLGWFSQNYPESTKFLVGRVIRQQLNRAYADDTIRVPISNYAEFSTVLSGLTGHASRIDFTCIFAPSEWFKRLDGRSVEHRCLERDEFPPAEGAPDFDPSALVTLGISNEEAGKYPGHYIQFLKRRSPGDVRHRVFLLDDLQWGKLVTGTNRPFFDKFMKPCKRAGVETRFVKVSQLRGNAASLIDELRKPIEDAVEGNVTHSEYTVFDGNAVMVYKESCDGDEPRSCEAGGSRPRLRIANLEFEMGDRARRYAAFIDALFAGHLQQSHGVHTPEQIESMLEDVPREGQPEAIHHAQSPDENTAGGPRTDGGAAPVEQEEARMPGGRGSGKPCGRWRNWLSKRRQ